MENFRTYTAATVKKANAEISDEIIFSMVKKVVDIYWCKKGFMFFSQDEMEDIRQDAVEKVLKNRHSYNSIKSGPETWISRVTRSSIADACCRKFKMVKTFAPDDIADFKDMAGNLRSDIVESEQVCRLIWKCIGRVGDDYLRICRMQVAGKKQSEIAEELGWTPEKLYVFCSKARVRLKKALGSDFLAEYGISA